MTPEEAWRAIGSSLVTDEGMLRGCGQCTVELRGATEELATRIAAALNAQAEKGNP